MHNEREQRDIENRIRRQSHLAVGVGFGAALFVISALMIYLAIS